MASWTEHHPFAVTETRNVVRLLSPVKSTDDVLQKSLYFVGVGRGGRDSIDVFLK